MKKRGGQTCLFFISAVVEFNSKVPLMGEKKKEKNMTSWIERGVV